MCLVLILIYIVCRLWLSPAGSLVALLVFMLSRSMLMTGEYLSQRHYVEGLIFSLGATLCFIKSMERTNRALPLAGGLLYLLGCLSKEIYVPLPLILLAIPVNNVKNRLGRLWPMFSITIVYTIWRWWLLGELFGGYGVPFSLKEILRLPLTVLEILGWKGALCWLFLIAAGTIMAMKAKKEWKIFIAVAVVMILLPVAPVIKYRSVRYAFLAALFLGILTGWCVDKVMGSEKHKRLRGVAVLVVLMVPALLMWHNMVRWRSDFRRHLERVRVEGEYVLTQGNSNEFIKDPSAASWFYSGLGWLRSHILGMPAGPRALFDAIGLLSEKKYRILVYDPGIKTLAVVRDYASDLAHFRSTIRHEAPLNLAFYYQEPIIRWELGPWKEGKYTFIFDDYHQVFYPLTPRGKVPVKLSENQKLRIRYASPDGWVTYSPRLRLYIKSGHGVLKWQR